MKSLELPVENSEFRELEPVNHWSACVSLSGISDTEFAEKIKESVLETGQNFLGFKVFADNQYIRTRYPRKKYGVPSIEDCRVSMDVLAQKCDTLVVEQSQSAVSRFRIVMGLLEGYGAENIVHTPAEVSEVLTEGKFDVRNGEVYSAAVLQGGDYSVYTEPMVVIEGSLEDIKEIYALADKFHQERFTVDDLGNFKSYTVETKYCTSPDPD